MSVDLSEEEKYISFAMVIDSAAVSYLNGIHFIVLFVKTSDEDV